RDPSGSKFRSHALVNGRGNKCNTPNVALPKFSHDCPGPLAVILSVAKQHVKSAAPRHGLIASDDLRKVGVGNLGDDESEDIAASGGETSGVHVFEVIELTNDIQHPAAGFFRDIWSVAEHTR